MNYIQHRPDLGQVVMPLIEVLAVADLSWENRATVADAIARCRNHWKSMEDERQMLEQREASGTCSQVPQGVPRE